MSLQVPALASELAMADIISHRSLISNPSRAISDPTLHDGVCSELATPCGLKSPFTVAAAIDHIPDGTADNDDSLPQKPKAIEVRKSGGFPRGETSRCKNWPKHYSGDRFLTVGEGACLQGFPHHHQFAE